MFERFRKKTITPAGRGTDRTILIEVPPRFFVLSGKKKGTHFNIDTESVTVGRGGDNDLCFEEDNSILERHARIFIKESMWVVEGLAESGRLLVDGKKVREAGLSDGSIIELGRIRLRFEDGRRGKAWSLYDRKEHKKEAFRIVLISVLLVIVSTVIYLLLNPPGPKVTRDFSDDTCLHFVPVVEDTGKRPEENKAKEYYIRGMGEYNRGNFNEAVECWKSALEIEPEHGNAGKWLAKVNKQLKEPVIPKRAGRRKTVRAKLEGKKLSGGKKHETAEMYYRKGRVFSAANDEKKALYYWRKVLKIIDDREDDLYRQALAKISELTGK